MEIQHETQVLAGLDLGRRKDFTAFAGVDRKRCAPPPPAIRLLYDPAMGHQQDSGPELKDKRTKRELLWDYDVTVLKRFDVGTDYVTIEEWLGKVYSRGLDTGGLRDTVLAIDRTGVGMAVCDHVVKEIRLANGRARIVPVNITGGRRVTPAEDGWGWNVPKKELVGVLQMLMGSKRLHMADTLEHAKTLEKELENFKEKVNESTANESYEAWRESDHDDLVLALCIVLWVAEKAQKQFWYV